MDALRAYALFMAGRTGSSSDDDERWPDLVLFLGDQVYADETSPEMRKFIVDYTKNPPKNTKKIHTA